MTGFARAERAALCELFLDVGPDAPTLCAGWLARDLAAHLALRENRPDAAAGIRVAPLAGWTARVQAAYARQPWPQLVEVVRRGPPRWSPAGLLPVVDEAVNLTDFFVHHEDVRRARPGWDARALDPAFDDALWRQLRRVARIVLRRCPVGVVLRRASGGEVTLGRPPRVTLTGPAPELLLYAFGRREHTTVDVEGDDLTLIRFADARLGV